MFGENLNAVVMVRMTITPVAYLVTSCDSLPMQYRQFRSSCLFFNNIRDINLEIFP